MTFFRVCMNIAIAINRITSAMIRPLLFCLLAELVYFLSKGLDVAYVCT